MATNVRKKGDGIKTPCLKSEEPLLSRDAGIITQIGDNTSEDAGSIKRQQSGITTPRPQFDDESMHTIRDRG